jgi:hypothetical protein
MTFPIDEFKRLRKCLAAAVSEAQIYADASALAALLVDHAADIEAMAKDAARYCNWRAQVPIWKPIGTKWVEMMAIAKTNDEVDAAIDTLAAQAGEPR